MSGGEAPAVVSVGGREVPLVVVRSARARRVTLRADAARGVIRVTMPRRAAGWRCSEILEVHAEWLVRRVSNWPPAVSYSPGAVVPVEGEPVTIDWRPGGAARAPVLEGGRLILGGTREALGGRVERFLKAMALARLREETRVAAARVGRDPPRVTLRDPATRWGSCSATGSISYSWRLILAPPFVRRYVVAHETAHLVHMNHGPAFHGLANDLHGDDPAPARHWLATNGPHLHRIGRSG